MTPEDRIRAILGPRGCSSLPGVSAAALLKFYRYLTPRLTLPFEARYCAQTEPVVYPVTVTGLVDPTSRPADPSAGLSCLTHLRNRSAVLPLIDVEVADDSPNFRLLEDYWYWLWNAREVDLRELAG
jgi:hypothetical protein